MVSEKHMCERWSRQGETSEQDSTNIADYVCAGNVQFSVHVVFGDLDIAGGQKLEAELTG